MHSILLEMLAKERNEELMREADRMRLVAISKQQNPVYGSRWLAALGDALIRIGQKLKQRQQNKVGLSARCTE